MHKASAILVLDPLQLPNLEQWACALLGATAFSCEYACSSGSEGIAIKFHSYAARRCVLHMTDAFCAEHPFLPSLIRACTPNWQHVDITRLVAVKARYRGSRAAELFVFCGRLEQFSARAAAYADVKYFLSEPYARCAVSSIDTLNSVYTNA